MYFFLPFQIVLVDPNDLFLPSIDLGTESPTSMNVFLDDFRDAPDDSWVRVQIATDAIQLLRDNTVELLSLDHDLGDEYLYGNGYQVLLWIEEQVLTTGYRPPRMLVHSTKTFGKTTKEKAIARICAHRLLRI